MKLEGEGPEKHLGMLDDSNEEMPQLQDMPAEPAPMVKFEPVYPARVYEQDQVENDWNMTEGLDQLHYL